MSLEQLKSLLQSGEVTRGLEHLSTQLRSEKRYSEWFEALKMRARHELGMPLWPSEDDPEPTLTESRELEDRLVEACRIVGQQMVQDGHIRDGWMYLRPVGDQTFARNLLLQVPINDETLDQVIEVAVGQAVHPAWGYRLLLDRMGTCNAITTYDTQMQGQKLSERQQAAGDLVRHLYDELVSGILYSIQNAKADTAADRPSLQELLDQNPQLTSDGGYHIDPSHLASAVRIARISDDPQVQRMAVQLCRYGQRLDASLAPQAIEPFDPYFESHRMYYEILLGEDATQKCLAHFRKQRHLALQETEDPGYSFGLEKQFETTETLIELLVRSGNFSEAITILQDQLARSGEHQRRRWMLVLLDCCRRANNYGPLQDFATRYDDPLAMAIACAQSVPSVDENGSH